MDEDLAIGKAINRLCPPGSGQYLKVSEIAQEVLPDLSGNQEVLSRALLVHLKGAVRRFLQSQRDICSVNGERRLVERFIHYPDGRRGDRWLRIPAITKAQLGYKIAQLRRQQRGYDVRCRVLESIYDALPDAESIAGDILKFEGWRDGLVVPLEPVPA